LLSDVFDVSIALMWICLADLCFAVQWRKFRQFSWRFTLA